MGKGQKKQTPVEQIIDINFVKDDKHVEKKRIFTPPQPLPRTSAEVRQSRDGGWYTKEQFESYYKGLSQWRAAKREPVHVADRRSKGCKVSVTTPIQRDNWRTNNAFAVLA